MTGPLERVRDGMAAAAAGWLASLTPEQRAKACYPFPADEERTTWYYTPTERGGLPLAEMGPVSQRLAHRLVASGLSEGGYNTAATVMGLENVLDAKEGWRRGYDGPLKVDLFFEDGEVEPSPWLLEGFEVLLDKDEVGAGLLEALAPEQRAAALLSETAPGDILQRNRPAVRAGPPEGLAAAGMLPQQRELLAGLLRQYLGRLPGPLAAFQAERVLGERLEEVHFGWAGGTEPGQPHYYRVQGPRLLIEYDNVQDGVNHVHSVWRDPAGDFGQSSTG